MTHPLRPYQLAAVERTLASTHRAVCNVAPTGAGKTRLGQEYITRELEAGGTALFIVHRRELLKQAADRLRQSLGHLAVGIIAPGNDLSPYAQVQVATVQTLLARSERPSATLIILDEAHHYAADVSWTAVLDAYPTARIIGLTATPQRQDGQPLGDLFTDMVVVAQYSELINDGFLVPCRVFQPPEQQGRDLALAPLAAYQRYAEDSLCFGFAPSVALAEQWATDFTLAGIPSTFIDGKMPKAQRDGGVAALRMGQIKVLWNYNILTEGVDIPEARAIIIGRPLHHVAAYLQACGRVLRPHTNKQDAIVIDLTGATLKHGFPTEDREYSLDGVGIRKSQVTPLRNCLQCGYTLHAAVMQCTECGYCFKKRDPRVPHIYSMELREAYQGKLTPSEHKQREYLRLRELGKQRGWSPAWVAREYRKLFAEPCVVTDATPEEQKDEYERLLETAEKRGYKVGWAAYRYKQLFGRWPTRRAA